MLTRQELYNQIRRSLLPLERQREAYAREVTLHSVKVSLTVLLVGIVFLLVVIYVKLYTSGLLLLGGIAILLGVPYKLLRPRFERPDLADQAIERYNQELSTQAYQQIVTLLGEDIDCQLQAPIDKKHIKATFLGTYLTHDQSRYFGRYYTQGVLENGRKFHCSELTIQAWTTTGAAGNNGYRQTIFQGFFVALEKESSSTKNEQSIAVVSSRNKAFPSTRFPFHTTPLDTYSDILDANLEALENGRSSKQVASLFDKWYRLQTASGSSLDYKLPFLVQQDLVDTQSHYKTPLHWQFAQDMDYVMLEHATSNWEANLQQSLLQNSVLWDLTDYFYTILLLLHQLSAVNVVSEQK